MKANFRRTDALLLLPILLLGGVGYWQQQRVQKLREPTHIEVRSLQILPPTPSDVARGFDTRVQLGVGYRGARPRGWGVISVHNTDDLTYGLRLSQVVAPLRGTMQRKYVLMNDVSSPWGEQEFDEENDVYRGTYALNLHGAPSDQPILLHGFFVSQELKNSTVLRNDVNNLAWRAKVREKGVQTPAAPKVSRYSGVKVTKIEYRDVTNGMRFFDVQVTCTFAPSVASQEPGTKMFTPKLEDIYLVDKKGLRYNCLGYGPIYDPNRPDNGSGPTPTFIFNSWETLPADVSGLTFHALLSVNDYWPLEIKQPIKNMPTFR